MRCSGEGGACARREGSWGQKGSTEEKKLRGQRARLTPVPRGTRGGTRASGWGGASAAGTGIPVWTESALIHRVWSQGCGGLGC